MYENYNFSISPHFDILECEVYLNVALICISLRNKIVEHIVMYLLAISISYLNKSLFNSFAHFFFNSKLLFIYLFILYLFLAVLGLRFCARAFSSCGKRGPLFIVVHGPLHYRGLSCCGAQAPDAQAQ